MSTSLNEIAGPQQVGNLQRELETGLARAATLEERMAVMMAMMDATLSGEMSAEPQSLESLENELGEEIAGREAAAFDREIEAGLREIREELEKQVR